MNYVPMDPEDIKKLLSQHSSCMPEIHRTDKEERQRINEQTCEKCATPLVARPVRDPRKLFKPNSTKINYESWCPHCGTVSG